MNFFNCSEIILHIVEAASPGKRRSEKKGQYKCVSLYEGGEMKKWLVMTVCLCLAAACAPESDVEALKSELMEADTAFARMAFEEGRNAAFLEFMDEDVTIMPRRGELIRGMKKYREQLSESGAAEPVVRWKPFFADVSKSGDLGYTMGNFQYFENRQEDADVLREGSYVTIWKKQPDGRWKFVFDAGNDKE